MPWQRLVADVGGELDPETGLPAYREVIFTVPRQSGKTTLILAWELQRALGWGEPQRIIYSAQSGKDAREKIMEDQAPTLELHRKALGITKITKGIGYESVRFANGSLIKLLASSEESGHGKTLDLAIKDEYFADEDDRRDQALVPAMTTRSSAQMLTATTAGTDRSIPWNRRQRLGREAVLKDSRSGIAYFEWSADPDDWDPADEEAWWEFMPALGHTIWPPAIRHAKDTLDADEFKRAYGNISHDTGSVREQVIPAGDWAACLEPDHDRSASPTYAIEVDPDGTAASIAASDGTFGFVLEWRRGSTWLPPVMAEIVADKPGAVWLDPKGPAGALIRPLTDVGVVVNEISARQYAQACAELYAAVVEDHGFRHAGQQVLDIALRESVRRTYGDGWVWDRRKPSTSVSPMGAVTIARWAALQSDAPPFTGPMVATT